MAVYLVRHAEDRAAADDRYADTGLSEQGRQQAEALAERLRATPFVRCFASPLLRAKETAEILTKDRDMRIEIKQCLQEGAIGDLDGLTHAEAKDRFPEAFKRGHTVLARLAESDRTAPGGETRQKFLLRAQESADLVRAELENDNSNSLIVSHGGLLHFLIWNLLQKTPGEAPNFGFDHASVLKIVSYREEPAFGPFPMLRFV